MQHIPIDVYVMVCVNCITYQCLTIMFDTIMPKFGRNPDQTSTPQCRSLVEVSTKLRPPSVEVWSQFGRSFVEVWSKFGVAAW